MQSSTSSGKNFSPATRMSAFFRPFRWRAPDRSRNPRSPVRNQPSRSTCSAQAPRRVVGGEEPVAPHRDLAQRLRGQPRAFVREHRDGVAGNGAAHRGRGQTFGAQVDARQTRLDDAVGLADRNAIDRLEAFHHRRRDRRRRGQGHANARQRLARPEIGHALEVQGRRVQHARAEAARAVHDRLRQRVGAQQDVGAGAHVRDDRDREVIGERQHPEDAVLLAEFEHAIGRLDARGGRLVGQDDALAPRRRAGREPDERGIELGELRGALGAAIDPLKRIAVAVAAPHDRAARRRVGVAGRARQRRRLRPRDAAVQLHLAHDLRDLGGREVAGERHEAGARGEQAERRRQIGEIVRGEQPDPLAGLDSLGLEERGDPLGFAGELAVAHGSARPHVGDGAPRRVSRRRREQDLGEVHRASAQRATARPTASPAARHVPITRAEPSASCVALMQRPATKRFSTSRA